MESAGNWEKQLLERLGLRDDHQLRKYLHKLGAFCESLEPDEKRVFLASAPTVQDALASLQLDITAEQLEKFLRERERTGLNMVIGARRINFDIDD